jgi:putative DNA methylase
MMPSFIEKQFPVSKVSKESYKERRAGSTQTLTKYGKWWGRKPLVLVRAAILGCLLPATDNPKKDMEIFLKIMTMDESGLWLRKEKNFSAADLYEIIHKTPRLDRKYSMWFELDESGEKVKVMKNAPRDEMERAAFDTLGYDAKIALCVRPEQTERPKDDFTWNEINQHLGTSAHSLTELTQQLSQKRFGKNVTVGDCFCGGGSIPFEAARMGCNTYASDLNPIAGLLTWSGIFLSSLSEGDCDEIATLQKSIFAKASEELADLGVETVIDNNRDFAFLYCLETRCPECGIKVPLAPSWVIGKGTKTVAKLSENGDQYDITVKMGATAQEMKEADNGTITSRGLVCPHCGKTTPIAALRHDRKDANGNTVPGLRQWDKADFDFRDDDIYSERLYAIKYEHTEYLPDGKTKTTRYYRAPNDRDMENERKVHSIVAEHIAEWQEQGLVPSMAIESGYNTDQVIRERGWTHWNHLFNTRQLLELATLQKISMTKAKTITERAISILNLNKCLNFNSKLCRWRTSGDAEHNTDTFYNQALNTLVNYGARPIYDLRDTYCTKLFPAMIQRGDSSVVITDARDVHDQADFWITDPPYADAVNYHELSEFFLAWDKRLLQEAFPEWYTDSKRILAVKGDEHFSQSMIEIYRNLTKHMPDDGMQIVMFTHSDPAVWAQLALIMWKAGLKVTAAWNIATETDASGLKDGNYVKGTVLLVLRKQVGNDEAFLDELNADVKAEVKNQIESMQALDDKEDPNFSDPDYVLAAYAASLKVLTSYKTIGEIDLDYELNLAIHEPAKSKVVALIERAKKIAYDFIIPLNFDGYLWKELTPAERFYVKGLESEKNGNYQISTYQEYARGFAISSYGQLMANERANTCRLKTPQEFAMRTIGDVPDFESSTLRLILAAIHIAIKEEENPEKGLFHIKNNLPDYWGSRDMIKQLLAFLKDTQGIENMPHWEEAAQMAEHIYVLVDNDHI